MNPAANRRARVALVWTGFVAAALLTTLAVLRLYATVQREIEDQSERAWRRETTAAVTTIFGYTEDVRRSTIRELASFHRNGLGAKLRQWDEANDVIVGTFVWDPVRGFGPDFVPPRGVPSATAISRFWLDFRQWRAAHAADAAFPHRRVDEWEERIYRTLDVPEFPAGNLGYQAENLELLTQAGHLPDPWAGWAGSVNDPHAPWVFWYQAADNDTVRGCFVDTGPIQRQLQRAFADTSYIHRTLLDAPATAIPTPDREVRVLPWLPGETLVIEEGSLFREKQDNARLTAIAAALLGGILLALLAVLAQRAQGAVRDAERKITFVGQVSHELRTPLTSIRMFADMLAEPSVEDGKRRRFADTISAESRRLESLIDRLLTFNSLQKRDRKIECRPVDVRAVVEESVSAMGATLQAAQLTVDLNLPEDSIQALSDHSTLKQALLNLLDNATKYARTGGYVGVAVGADARQISVRISDRGPGIPPPIRERIFEPFFQGGHTLTDKPPGVGLGLSIAREMLRAAGADLVLRDSAAGASFEILLPRLTAA